MKLLSPIRRGLLLATACWLAVHHTQTTTAQEAVMPGPAVGEKLPEIKLKDQTAQPIAISELLSKGPVALVLFRSADW